jgi:O-antigen ligase
MEEIRENKNTSALLRYIDILMYISLGLAVMTSQLSIAASSIGVGALVILTALKVIFDRDLKFGYKTILYLTGAFILAQAISSVFSSDPAHAFDHIYRKISIYIVFFASIITIKGLKDLQKFLAVYFIFTAIISCVEISKFIIDYSSISKPISEFRLEYYGYPITNGEIKMLILLIIIPLIISKAGFILNKITLILLSLPLLFTFYLTNARNALLGLFTGLLVYGAIKNRYFLAGLIAVVTLFILLAPLSVKERLISIADINHPSNHTRLVIWDTGKKMIMDNLLIGIGDVDIKKAYEEYKKPEFHGEGSHMHNNLIQIALTTGLLGLLIWLGLMGTMIFYQIKNYIKTAKNEFLNTIAVISLCSMTAFQVSGLTEWNFGDAEFAAVLWFNLALAFIAAKIYKAEALSLKLKTNG